MLLFAAKSCRICFLFYRYTLGSGFFFRSLGQHYRQNAVFVLGGDSVFVDFAYVITSSRNAASFAAEILAFGILLLFLRAYGKIAFFKIHGYVLLS